MVCVDPDDEGVIHTGYGLPGKGVSIIPHGQRVNGSDGVFLTGIDHVGRPVLRKGQFFVVQIHGNDGLPQPSARQPPQTDPHRQHRRWPRSHWLAHRLC